MTVPAELPALCADLPPATPAAVRALREGADLSLAEAAALIGIGDRGTWARWERDDHHSRAMPLQAWALALLALGQHPHYRANAGKPQPSVAQYRPVG